MMLRFYVGFVMLLTGLAACAPAPPTSHCNTSSSIRDLTDSTALEGIEELAPAAVGSDTAYYFHASESWGAFEYWCAVYANQMGYWAAMRKVNQSGYNSNHEIVERQFQLTTGQWKGIQRNLTASGFWCAEPDFECYSTDFPYFRWVAKEGKVYKAVDIRSFGEPFPDTLDLWGNYLQSMCGRFGLHPCAYYATHGDSLYLKVFDQYHSSFPQHTWVEIRGERTENIVSHKGGLKYRAFPRKDTNVLNEVWFGETSPDGFTARMRVTNFQKISVKELKRYTKGGL